MKDPILKGKLNNILYIILAFLFLFLVGSNSPTANIILDLLRPFLLLYLLYLGFKIFRDTDSNVKKVAVVLAMILVLVLLVVSLADIKSAVMLIRNR